MSAYAGPALFRAINKIQAFEDSRLVFELPPLKSCD